MIWLVPGRLHRLLDRCALLHWRVTLGVPMFALAIALLQSCTARADTVALESSTVSGLLGFFLGQPWAIYVVLAAALLPWLAAIVPQAAPGSPWAPARKVLDVLAGNVGNAANATLKTPLLASSLAKPLPQAIFAAEHALEVFALGMRVGQNAAAPAAPPDPPPAAIGAAVPPAPAQAPGNPAAPPPQPAPQTTA